MTIWGWYLQCQKEDAMTIDFFASFVGCRLLVWQQESGCTFVGFLPSSTWLMRGAASGRARPSRGAEKRRVEVFTKQEAKIANEKTKIGERRETFTRFQERSSSPQREGPQGLPASSALRKVLKAHTKRKQLSTQRLRKNAQRMRASIGEKSLLEASSIKVNQRLDYAKRLEVPASLGQDRAARRSSLRVRRPRVPQWRGGTLWREASGSIGVRATRVFQDGFTHAPTLPKMHERLEKDGTNSDSIAYAGVHEDRNQCSVSSMELQRGGALQRSDLQHILPSRRNVEGACSGCGSPKSGFRALCDSAGAHGEGRIFQGGNLRRGADPRRCQVPMVANPTAAALSAADQAAWPRGSTLELQRKAVSGQVEACGGSSGLRGSGNYPIPEQTWGCKPGPFEEAPKCGSYPKEGAVGFGQFSSNLRQARSHATSDQSVWQQSSRSWGGGATQLQHLLPEWHWSTPQADARTTAEDLSHVKFLSLFGGVGEASKFVARCGGVSALVDWDKSPFNDLSKPSRWKDVGKLLEDCNLVGIDLPCPTWSRARRAPRWSKMPSPLRDDFEYIWGLPDLTAAEQDKVTKANHMTWGALRVIRLCIRLGIAGYLENPWTSRLWLVRGIRRLLKSGKAFLIRVDQCQYGNQWKKPTGLLIWGCFLFQLKICGQGSTCSRTRKPHLQLTGAFKGKFLTRQAQVYTQQFASAVISNIAHHAHHL